ncbi:MAG TPA: hypothetical protein VHR42_04165 [Clostridia bacterium]|nr:hypothetical protein [Clostridia bacterium]
MMELCCLTGVFTGGCVCVFGMWAFLKGQRSMFQIKNGEAPTELFAAKAIRGGGEKSGGESDQPDIAEQLRSMFGDLPDEGGEED